MIRRDSRHPVGMGLPRGPFPIIAPATDRRPGHAPSGPGVPGVARFGARTG